MLIYAIDDEPLPLEALEAAIRDAAPEAEVRAFGGADALLAALAESRGPSAVFADIAMPDMTGLELAARIRKASPDTEIVFVTGFPQYAVEAYRLHARGYIMKPVTPGRVREELAVLGLLRPAQPAPERLRVQCFGYFDVFYGDEPVIFRRRKTRELLAYLVDRNGAACDADELTTALWEGEGDLTHRKSYLRALTTDLRRTLAPIGMEDVLIRLHNQWAVRTELLDCDYYRMMAGDRSAAGAYHGEYMIQYSWAELTASKLQFSQQQN